MQLCSILFCSVLPVFANVFSVTYKLILSWTVYINFTSIGGADNLWMTIFHSFFYFRLRGSKWSFKYHGVCNYIFFKINGSHSIVFLWLFPSHWLNFFYKKTVPIFCKAKKVSEYRCVYLCFAVSSSHLKPFEVFISQWACVRRETKARNPSLFALQAFSHEILSHSHFTIMWLVCSLSANKPQTQKGKNVVRLWAAVSLRGALCDIQKTAAEETTFTQTLFISLRVAV